MRPEAAFIDLLERIVAVHPAPARISAAELMRFPQTAVAALKKQNLLTPTKAASSIVCRACEKHCNRPVHAATTASGEVRSFIVCEQLSDVNRVPVKPPFLEQWQITFRHLANFVAADLSIRPNFKTSASHILGLGLGKGKKRTQLLRLRCAEELLLEIGDKSIPLAELVAFDEDRFTLEQQFIQQAIDDSGTGDPRHTPSIIKRENRKLSTQARNERWRKEYRVLSKTHPGQSDKWISNQIANRPMGEGKSSETIRKNMK
jgi:hypothetical protein